MGKVQQSCWQLMSLALCCCLPGNLTILEVFKPSPLCFRRLNVIFNYCCCCCRDLPYKVKFEDTK